MSKIIILIILYLLIGVIIAMTPYRQLKKINNDIESGDYEALEVYDLLLFKTVIDVSPLSTKIFIFISMVLFYPVLLINNIKKQKGRKDT